MTTTIALVVLVLIAAAVVPPALKLRAWRQADRYRRLARKVHRNLGRQTGWWGP